MYLRAPSFDWTIHLTESSIRRTVHSDHPFSGWRNRSGWATIEPMLLETGLILLSIAVFAILNYYVRGCERL
jgi:hypothetical protein